VVEVMTDATDRYFADQYAREKSVTLKGLRSAMVGRPEKLSAQTDDFVTKAEVAALLHVPYEAAHR
jgi:hypothetical protein